MHLLLRACLALAACGATTAVPSKPNVLFLLTDDQDIRLGSMDPDGPMQKTRQLLVDQGAWFNNGFANTPICCPSRAEIQTGRYMHNTKVYGNDCGGMDFINGPEKMNVASYAKSLGYTTFYAGKYLNTYGSANVGGLKRIPPGWDQWYGLQGNSKYYGYAVSNNGVAEQHGNDYATDYFTDRLANRTLEFLANATKNKTPFFAMVGTPACHGPNDQAPQYMQTYAGMTSPRVPSWNKAPQPDKHWLLRQIVPMDSGHTNVSDVTFQRRWSVLRSVDDLVERWVTFLTDAGVMNNTYFLYSSDHGYHLGEFGMVLDKRMLYETDIRVPLFVRGPGIPAGLVINDSAVHVDLTPTMLEMMGMSPTDLPAQMDGRSWLSLVKPTTTNGGDVVMRRRGVAQFPSRTFMVEYSGGGQPEEGEYEALYGDHDAMCTAVGSDENSLQGKCSCTFGAVSGNVHDQSPCDGGNNTYACIRTLGWNESTIFCVFDDTENFIEYYDLTTDPWNLHNLASTTPAAKLAMLQSKLAKVKACTGVECRGY